MIEVCLSVYKDGSEYVYQTKPERCADFWKSSDRFCGLPKEHEEFLKRLKDK